VHVTTPEENKAVVRRFVDAVQNKGNIDATDEFIAENATDHTPPPGVPGTREGAKQIFAMIRQGFPDHDAAIIHIVAEDDLVAVYKTFSGTHKGEFLGVPATGKRVTIRVMDFVRIRDGKIADHWNIVDVAGLMAQLGVAP
jgi:steroid delta-isomerase-like uncharacterized protein